MSTAASENQCTGCGATVTVGRDLNLRDVSGSKYCPKSILGHMLSKPSPKPLPEWCKFPNCNSIVHAGDFCYSHQGCQSTFDQCRAENPPVDTSGFVGQLDELQKQVSPELPPVAIKPEVTLTPLENELLAALKKAAGFIGNTHDYKTGHAGAGNIMREAGKAIAKAEAVGA